MMYDMDYATAVSKAAALIELGQDVVYLRNEEGFPWDKAKDCVTGSSYRLNGPSSMYVEAEDAGLTFRLSIDFEGHDANGRGVSLFDRERLRDVAMKLPPAARQSFADMLAREVLPPMTERTAEIRKALNSQIDSEDCVRGILVFARESLPA